MYDTLGKPQSAELKPERLPRADPKSATLTTDNEAGYNNNLIKYEFRFINPN